MTTVFKGLLKTCWQPQKCSVRYRVRYNIQKPRPRHHAREVMQKLCEPVFPRAEARGAERPVIDVCGIGVRREEIDNPYAHLLAKDVLNWFDRHNSIFFFHTLSSRGEDVLETMVLLKKVGLTCRKYSKSIMHEALSGTIYESALVLFQGHTYIGFGQDVNVKNLLKTSKKCHNFILMAGIHENRLMSLSDMKRYADLPDIQILRSWLCASLSAASRSTVERLNHHQSTLVQNLKQHAKSSRGE